MRPPINLGLLHELHVSSWVGTRPEIIRSIPLINGVEILITFDSKVESV